MVEGRQTNQPKKSDKGRSGCNALIARYFSHLLMTSWKEKESNKPEKEINDLSFRNGILTNQENIIW